MANIGTLSIMLFMLVTILLVLQQSSFASPAVSMQRNLAQFAFMIQHKGYDVSDYNGYGCWCGSGNYGSRVFDETDNCCRVHDQCYDKISGGFFGCSPKIVTYDWKKLPNRNIVCMDAVESCDRKTCECDKIAVDCFERHRATYDLRRRKSGNSKVCS